MPTRDARDLRTLIPQVVSTLVGRGVDFASAEDAVQAALIDLLGLATLPDTPKAWLIRAAWRRFIDQTRSEGARRAREEAYAREPAVEIAEKDDSLWLYFLCAHPSLTPASAVALTLRAVGGLTTAQIAAAYLVPESTMAQRISRAKAQLREVPLDVPGDVTRVLRILYLLFNEGYSGEIDLAAEAIRLTRQLAARVDDPEVQGLLALMLLHHARRAARLTDSGRLIPLADQDRSQWNTELISDGVDILQAALARGRLGEYQAQAAIAALHADAKSADETDWVQIVEWYDELLALTASDVVRVNRAVAVGEADGPQAGLAALAETSDATPRRAAVSAYLHERAGAIDVAIREYEDAAARATSVAEREHLLRQAARLAERSRG